MLEQILIGLGVLWLAAVLMSPLAFWWISRSGRPAFARTRMRTMLAALLFSPSILGGSCAVYPLPAILVLAIELLNGSPVIAFVLGIVPMILTAGAWLLIEFSRTRPILDRRPPGL